ncbi:hypothetical protein V8G54_005433 [Vigna mungo]|uniref:CHD subfamily II SANT-like domain-containing protein n=1 Tax=Vigna mungo TaxID=3915 RepID=A0AAQ3NZQ8_VIGMU
MIIYYSLISQMVSVEEDDLAGLEDVSSDGEDDNYEAELTDGDSNSTGTGTTTAKRPYKKKARSMCYFLINFLGFCIDMMGLDYLFVMLIFNLLTADSTEPLPLMEGEGKAFRVLGFNQNQRAAFVQILMRFLSLYSVFIC